MVYYKLDGKVPVPCSDVVEWARFFESQSRVIKQDRVGHYFVSTVFVGIDHRFGDGPPLLFETMIFDHSKDVVADYVTGKRHQMAIHPSLDYQVRTSTWELAVEEHAKAVEYARSLVGVP